MNAAVQLYFHKDNTTLQYDILMVFPKKWSRLKRGITVLVKKPVSSPTSETSIMGTCLNTSSCNTVQILLYGLSKYSIRPKVQNSDKCP